MPGPSRATSAHAPDASCAHPYATHATTRGPTDFTRATTSRSTAATAANATDQPHAPASVSAASSGSAGWIATSAANRGPARPVAAPYPNATAAVTTHTIAA